MELPGTLSHCEREFNMRRLCISKEKMQMELVECAIMIYHV